MLNTSKYELWKFKIHFQCHYSCYHNIFTSASTPGSQNPERKSICFNSKLIISKKTKMKEKTNQGNKYKLRHCGSAHSFQT